MDKSVYPFSDQNGAKTLPDGAAHTYMAYMREYPPGVLPSQVFLIYVTKVRQDHLNFRF